MAIIDEPERRLDMDRIIYAIKRRPIRVVEAAVGLLAALGVVLLPEVEEAIFAVAVAVVAIAGGEVAQTRTTPTVDPRLDDGHDDQA